MTVPRPPGCFPAKEDPERALEWWGWETMDELVAEVHWSDAWLIEYFPIPGGPWTSIRYVHREKEV